MNNIVSRDVTLSNLRSQNIMALTNVIGRCKRHDVIDALSLFEYTLCVNSLFPCKCDRLDNFTLRDREK